jgi:hypothetical protein
MLQWCADESQVCQLRLGLFAAVMGAVAIILAVSIVIALFLRRRPRNNRSKQEVAMENAL